MAQLTCINVSWPLTNRHLVGVASHLLSLRCIYIYIYISFQLAVGSHGGNIYVRLWKSVRAF